MAFRLLTKGAAGTFIFLLCSCILGTNIISFFAVATVARPAMISASRQAVRASA